MPVKKSLKEKAGGDCLTSNFLKLDKFGSPVQHTFKGNEHF